MRGVEVVMGQPISHAGYVLPGNLTLPVEGVGVDPLNRLPYLNQTKPDSVKDETVVQVSPLKMSPDSLHRVDDVLQPLPI